MGAIALDWPRYCVAMALRDGWIRFRNRRETLTVDPRTNGASCNWQFTSDLHLCNVFPSTGRWLMRRALARWPIMFAERPPDHASPRVSFIIGHRGEARLPHLLATVATIAAQKRVPVECIVVEQSEQAIAKRFLPDWVRHLHTPVGSDSEPYNRARTLNDGARAARSSFLVLHDNDYLVPAEYAASLVERRDEGSEFIDLKRFMFYLDAEDTNVIFKRRDLSRCTPDHVTQNLLAGGSVAADRAAYFEIGGFDESFVGWGGEDNDFWERAMTRRTNAFAYLPFVHLWHRPQPEKVAVDPAGGRARYIELADVPAEERIIRLRATLRDGET
jgi:hypothetical protein